MQVTFTMQIGKAAVDIFCNHCIQPMLLTYTALHNHRYGEVHLLMEGQVEYTIDGVSYTFGAGDAVFIPAKVFHTSKAVDRALFFTFMVRSGPKAVTTGTLSANVLRSLSDGVRQSQQQQDLQPVFPYFYMLCQRLLQLTPPAVRENKDYPELIFKYLDDHYSQQISLTALAEKIGLSPKQAQRIIQKETGKTFLEELTERRMYTAQYLITHTDMTAWEIAQYVGYNSYSGFWKARSNYLKKSRPASKS